MEFNYFDIVAAIIILFLGLKGILNGFFKELFGLIGIIGGIFIASRVGDEVGQYVSDMVFKFENHAAISFTGFLVTLAGFWLFMVIVGMIFKKLSSVSGLGPVDKILGFIFGASKFFLIASVIAHAAYNIETVKSSIDSNMQNKSILFPLLVKTGGFIMKLDPATLSKNVDSSISKTIKKTTEAVHETVEHTIEDSTHEVVEKVKEQIKHNMPEIAKDI